MIIITIRTDKPEAELGLYDGEKQLAYDMWHAHKELSVTIHDRLRQLLTTHGLQLTDIHGIVCFQGPGSFTGLRIGITVANALAASLQIPIVGSQDPAWLETGLDKLSAGQNDRLVLPFYGAEAHITPQKK